MSSSVVALGVQHRRFWIPLASPCYWRRNLARESGEVGRVKLFGRSGFPGRISHSPKTLPLKFIMLPNEIFALACRAYYDEEGLIVDSSNGQFAHSPQTRKECDTGYYLLWGHHQHQGLLQSKDLDKCCFFWPDTINWLRECDYFPENYFELWDIYEKYMRELCSKASKQSHTEKDDLGRSVNAVKAGKAGHEEKDDLGRSVNAVKAVKAAHEEKDEYGKSATAKKAGAASALVRSKKVLVTFSDGSQQYFNSIQETSHFFCVTPMAVIFRTRKNLPSKKGKLACYRFELV